MVVVVVVIVFDVIEVDHGIANGVPGVPRDLQDHERDRETDDRVGDLRTERDNRGARDHSERHEPVDPRVLSVRGHRG